MDKDILKVDSCVIGSSIAGLWTALELAKRGQKVLVIDKSYIGREKGSIDLCLSHLSSNKMLQIATKAQKKWTEIKEHYGSELNIEPRGSVSFALTNEDSIELEQTLESQQRANNDTGSFIIKDKQAIKTLLKARDLGDLVKEALINVEDISLNNQTCLDYLRQQLIKQGAQFWGSDEVLDFDIQDNTIKSIITKDTAIEVKHLILASGAKSGKLLQKLELNMPLRPARAHVIEFTSKVKLPEQIMHYKTKYGDYIYKPLLNGRHNLIYTGTDDQMQATWSREVNMQVVNSSMVDMMRILPVLEYADIQDSHTVQLAITPDRLPYVGKTKKYNNLYLNIGLNGLNYLVAPLFAEKIANIVTTSRNDSELADLSPDRFMDL